MQRSQIFVQNGVFCLPHLHSTPPPLGGSPSEYRHSVWHGKNYRVVWLPDGEKISKICLFISTQLTNVTDTRTHGQTDTACRHRPRLCIASRGKNHHGARHSKPRLSQDVQWGSGHFPWTYSPDTGGQFPRDNFPSPLHSRFRHYHPSIYNIKRSTANVYKIDRGRVSE